MRAPGARVRAFPGKVDTSKGNATSVESRTHAKPAIRDARREPGGRPMTRTRPPFRADHVGSLLRTAPLKEARAKRERGEITAEQLKVVEDREIAAIIK